MKRCPVCKARLKDNPVCRRCKADLNDLFILENQADYMMVRAVQRLQAGDFTQAIRYCRHANNLKKTQFGELFSDFLRNGR